MTFFYEYRPCHNLEGIVRVFNRKYEKGNFRIVITVFSDQHLSNTTVPLWRVGVTFKVPLFGLFREGRSACKLRSTPTVAAGSVRFLILAGKLNLAES